jgi:hypothetical protein
MILSTLFSILVVAVLAATLFVLLVLYARTRMREK